MENTNNTNVNNTSNTNTSSPVFLNTTHPTPPITNNPNVWNTNSSNNVNTDHWTRTNNLILGAPREMIEYRPSAPTPPIPYNGRYPFYFIDTNFTRLTAIQYYSWRAGNYHPTRDTVRPQVIYPPRDIINVDFWNSWRPLRLPSNEIAHHRDIGTYWICSDDAVVVLVFGTGTWIEVQRESRVTENTDPENEVGTTEDFVRIFNYGEVTLEEGLRVSFSDTIYPLLDPMAGVNVDTFINMLDEDTVTDPGSDFDDL